MAGNNARAIVTLFAGARAQCVSIFIACSFHHTVRIRKLVLACRVAVLSLLCTHLLPAMTAAPHLIAVCWLARFHLAITNSLAITKSGDHRVAAFTIA